MERVVPGFCGDTAVVQEIRIVCHGLRCAMAGEGSDVVIDVEHVDARRIVPGPGADVRRGDVEVDVPGSRTRTAPADCYGHSRSAARRR